MKRVSIIRCFVLLLVIAGCQKERVIFRYRYIGDYEFTTQTYLRINNNSTGQFIETFDTIAYTGRVEKYGADRLRIEFLPNSTEPDPERQSFPVQINGLVYPVISKSDSISYPEFAEVYGEWFFKGHFNEDTVFMSYGVAYHVGKQSVKIVGFRL